MQESISAALLPHTCACANSPDPFDRDVHRAKLTRSGRDEGPSATEFSDLCEDLFGEDESEEDSQRFVEGASGLAMRYTGAGMSTAVLAYSWRDNGRPAFQGVLINRRLSGVCLHWKESGCLDGERSGFYIAGVRTGGLSL